MKRLFALIFVLIFSFFIACGGGDDSESSASKSGSEVVDEFFASIFEKGDLNTAYENLAGADRAMLGMFPGFYDFITNNESEDMPEDLKLVRVFIQEAVPIPDNVVSYKVGQVEGSGDTLWATVEFWTPTEEFESFISNYIDPVLLAEMDNLSESNLPFEEKAELIKKTIKQFKDGVEGKNFDREKTAQDIMIVREGGKWNVSLLATGFADAFGDM